MAASLAGVAPRTRKIVTETTEEVPVEKTSKFVGLGMPWQEFCAELTDATLSAITDVYIYRVDSNGRNVFQIKTHEPIDEEWIRGKFGGGAYNIKIYRKPNISHFEKNVVIDGPEKTAPTAIAAEAAAHSDGMTRVIGLLEKTIERLDSRTMPPPSPDPEKQASAASTMADATKKIIDAALSVRPPEPKPPATDPTQQKILDILITRALEPPKERSLDDDLTRLEKLKTIITPAAAATAEGGPVATVKMISELAGLLDKLRGGGPAGEVDWKAALIQVIGEKAPEILERVQGIFEANARNTEARARGAQAVATLRTQPPAPGAPTAPGGPPVSPGPRAVTAPAPAPPAWAPFETAPAAEAPAEAPAVEVIPPAEAVVIDRFFKQRLVALVAEKADPVMIITVIDGMAPALAAILGNFNRAQIHEFLAKDAILAEITRMPHYEAFLHDFLAALKEGYDEGEENPAPTKPN